MPAKNYKETKTQIGFLTGNGGLKMSKTFLVQNPTIHYPKFSYHACSYIANKGVMNALHAMKQSGNCSTMC